MGGPSFGMDKMPTFYKNSGGRAVAGAREALIDSGAQESDTKNVASKA
jgi:hypothetical protein